MRAKTRVRGLHFTRPGFVTWVGSASVHGSARTSSYLCRGLARAIDFFFVTGRKVADGPAAHTARALAPSTALPRRSHARAWTDAMAARERERLRQAELESDRLREELETVANHLAHERAERERDAARWRARESAANDRERLARTRIAALEVRA